MLAALLPDDVRPAEATVPVWTDPQEADLDRVATQFTAVLDELL